MADDPVLARHVVFADSDNGDALTWDREAGAASAIFRFAPRSFAPEREPIATSAGELLRLLAKKNLSFDRGPIRPFFVPERERARWQARMPGKRATKRAIDAWLARLERDGEATLLSRTDARDHFSLRFHLRAPDALARLQHVGQKDGFFQLSIDAPEGTKKDALDPFLTSTAALGIDETARTALTKAKRPR
jgi:hypothetical protein